MSVMHKAAITAANNGSRTIYAIAAIVGISPRICRRLCRQMGITPPTT